MILTICKLNLFGGVKVKHLAKWFGMVTGREMDYRELLLAGERIYNVKRPLNLRWGVSPEMDTIPNRMLSMPKKEGPSKGNLTPLKLMLEQYYRARGWDASGGPSQKWREKLRI